MTAAVATAIDNRWQNFSQLAQSALQPIGLMQGPAQWIVAEPCEDGGRCVFSYGPGPLDLDVPLSWPLPDAPQSHQDGFLVATPLATQEQGYLGLWVPETAGPPCDTDLALLHSKAILLGALLDQIRTSERLLRELEDVRHEAHTDALTGLFNRRGWLQQVEREQARCDRYGADCSMVAVDLDELKRVNDEQAARGFCDRLKDRLQADGIAASVGTATRRADETLARTLCRADANMYTEKHARRA